jgi:hypothetical protein
VNLKAELSSGVAGAKIPAAAFGGHACVSPPTVSICSIVSSASLPYAVVNATAVVAAFGELTTPSSRLL